MAYRSFSPSAFEARGARKVTTGTSDSVVQENMDNDSSPESSQPLPSGGAQRLFWEVFPSSDPDPLYAEGESQQTSASQVEEESEWLSEVDQMHCDEPLNSKKFETFYEVVADIPKLRQSLQKLVSEQGTRHGWCNLVLLATNKGERASDPHPETRKGYVQVSLNKFNKVRDILWLGCTLLIGW